MTAAPSWRWIPVEERMQTPLLLLRHHGTIKKDVTKYEAIILESLRCIMLLLKPELLLLLLGTRDSVATGSALIVGGGDNTDTAK